MNERLSSDALLKNALRDVPMHYLLCRDVRHRWGITTDLHATGEEHQLGIIVQRDLECQRCATHKTDRYVLRRTSRTGAAIRLQILGSWYSYPEHYIIPEMARAEHAKEILRAERYRRLVG